MKFKFLGKPDFRFPNLKTGKTYDLTIKEESMGLFGFLVGNMRPEIVKPFYCPYSSWRAFDRNWRMIV
jgi:hypothetical protein